MAGKETRKRKKRPSDEPTLKCQRNPFIGALGIQEPVHQIIAETGNANP